MALFGSIWHGWHIGTFLLLILTQLTPFDPILFEPISPFYYTPFHNSTLFGPICIGLHFFRILQIITLTVTKPSEKMIEIFVENIFFFQDFFQ